MKAVILAGGRGTRISEESIHRPKPLVEIGGMPILWHIMKTYEHYGVNDFVICAGFKAEQIKEFFLNYSALNSDMTIDMNTGEVKVHKSAHETWRVTIVDTGLDTNTGGRLKRVHEYIKDEEFFFLTYGDGVADINITASLEYHKKMGLLATMTGVRPAARFGSAEIVDGKVTRFVEKRQASEGIINGGYFVLSPKVIDFIEGDSTSWEFDSLEHIVQAGELAAYQHDGFWQPMDTLREKEFLNELIEDGKAPWIK